MLVVEVASGVDLTRTLSPVMLLVRPVDVHVVASALGLADTG